MNTKHKIISFIRQYIVPRSELDLMVAHRDAIRDHFSKLQKEYLELESKMFSETGYAMADVEVSVVELGIETDSPFCWRFYVTVSRDLTIALRNRVKTELLPYIAEGFKRDILEKLNQRWNGIDHEV